MHHLLNILAADDWSKLIIAAVVFGFWIVSALLGGGKKKPETLSERMRATPNRLPTSPLQQLQRQVAEQIRQARADAAARIPRVPPPPTAQARRPAPSVRRPIPTIPSPARPAPAMVRPAPAPNSAAPLSDAQPAKLLRVQGPSASSETLDLIRSLSPMELRKQIVLSEILQPPVALR